MENCLNTFVALTESHADAKPVLCSRCGYFAENFNRSKVYCSFLLVGKKIFYFILVYFAYMIYICAKKTDKK